MTRADTSCHPDSMTRLLAAAFEVFCESGYRASIDAVAKRANVARQTLYNNFPSKEALFAEACGSLEPQPLALALATEGTPARVLEAVALKALQACVSPWHARLHRRRSARHRMPSDAAHGTAVRL